MHPLSDVYLVDNRLITETWRAVSVISHREYCAMEAGNVLDFKHVFGTVTDVSSTLFCILTICIKVEK